MMHSITTEPVISNRDGKVIKLAAKAIRALNHPLRMKILDTIRHNGNSIKVTDLYTQLGISQSETSQHLAILRNADAVTTKKDNKFVLYSVNYNKIAEILEACINI